MKLFGTLERRELHRISTISFALSLVFLKVINGFFGEEIHCYKWITLYSWIVVSCELWDATFEQSFRYTVSCYVFSLIFVSAYCLPTRISLAMPALQFSSQINWISFTVAYTALWNRLDHSNGMRNIEYISRRKLKHSPII